MLVDVLAVGTERRGYLNRCVGSRSGQEDGGSAPSMYYVYTDAGDSIDETLVAEGLAVAWTRDGQHRGLLVDVEQRAREHGVGCLW